MNKEEANSIFMREVERFRTMPYDEFVRTIKNDVYTAEHVGLSGTRYLIELKTRRKKRKRDIVRVSASIRSLDDILYLGTPYLFPERRCAVHTLPDFDRWAEAHPT